MMPPTPAASSMASRQTIIKTPPRLIFYPSHLSQAPHPIWGVPQVPASPPVDAGFMVWTGGSAPDNFRARFNLLAQRILPMKSGVKKVVLAYSGGLDTSVILKWLQETYACEVVTFTADLGQGEELEPARKKAELLGVKPENIFIDDLREEFVRDFVFPMFRANTLYEGTYLLAPPSPGR